MPIDRKKKYTVENLVEGIINCNRVLLSKSITIVESNLPEDRKIARLLIDQCLTAAGNSVRIGVTGVPGSGKSTFIEALGSYLIEKKNKKVAVLAVDPTSTLSHGSILGDKTRMNALAVNKDAYIRPSPTSGFLGGVAATTKESIILLEAAGFDIILIETVGVGQSEIEVSQMVDFFLLLMLTGAGDDLQGIKRGIMEMADAIIINKAEKDNVNAASLAKRELESSLQMFSTKESGWKTKVEKCSALEKMNIDQVWSIIEEYVQFTKKNQFFEKNRNHQNLNWFKRSSIQMMFNYLRSNPDFLEKEKNLSIQVEQGKMSPFIASEKLFEDLKVVVK